MKHKIFAANWKLYKNPSETKSYFEQFFKNARAEEKQFMFFPPATSWETCSHLFSQFQNQNVIWGGQNIFEQSSGAFTGENSAQTLKDLGGRACLVGHSERRKIFGEKDESLNKKIKLLISLGLLPVFCIGETLEERQSNRTIEVVSMQLRLGLQDVAASSRIIFAYEPVWAIGTGQVATPEQVKETHAQIKTQLRTLGFSQSELLYGGSVKPENAQGLLAIPDVDGFLVGGASLEVSQFLAIAGQT